MDPELKKSFDALRSQFGHSTNAAMNVFARAVVQCGKIPFELVSDKVAAAKQVQSAIDKFFSDNKMGMEEIEAILGEHLRTPYSHAQK